LGTSQAPVAKASETDVLPSSTTVNLPDQNLLHPGNKCSFQATPAPVSLAVKPQVYDEFSSNGHVTVTRHKHGPSFNGSASSAYFGTEFHHGIHPLVGVSRIPLPLTYSTNCKDNLTWASCEPKCASSIYYSRPSFMTQWAPSTRKASTPFPSGLDFTSKNHSAQVEEPVDSLIDNLREGQETVFRLSLITCKQTQV